MSFRFQKTDFTTLKCSEEICTEDILDFFRLSKIQLKISLVALDLGFAVLNFKIPHAEKMPQRHRRLCPFVLMVKMNHIPLTAEKSW